MRKRKRRIPQGEWAAIASLYNERFQGEGIVGRCALRMRYHRDDERVLGVVVEFWRQYEEAVLARQRVIENLKQQLEDKACQN